MKSKLNISSTVSLDEIADQLRDQLSPEELAQWAINIGDKHGDCIEYWTCLYNKSKKVYKAITEH